MKWLIFLCWFISHVANAQYLWRPSFDGSDNFKAASAGAACALYTPELKAAIDSIYPDNTYSLKRPFIEPHPSVDSIATCAWNGSGKLRSSDILPISGRASSIVIWRGGSECSDQQGGICKDDDSPPQCPCEGKEVPQGGNPINLLAGSKSQKEVFFSSLGPFPLRFSGTYNSSRHVSTSVVLEGRWTWSHTQKLLIDDFGANRDMVIVRERGQRVGLSSASAIGAWSGDPDIIFAVEDITSFDAVGDIFVNGYEVTTIDDTVELYDRFGILIKVTNSDGLSHLYSYDGDEITVLDDFGNSIVITMLAQKPTKLVGPDGFEYKFQYNSRN